MSNKFRCYSPSRVRDIKLDMEETKLIKLVDKQAKISKRQTNLV